MAYKKSHSHFNVTAGSVASSVSPSLNFGPEKSGTVTVDSDPASVEIDNFLSRLTYQKTFQDEDSHVSKSAAVLSNPDVSKVMGSLVGKDKQELKADTRQLIGTLEKFFKDYLKGTKSSDGSKAVELLQELFHTPEYVAFQQVLFNEPTEWIDLALPILQDKARKDVMAEQIEKDMQNVQLNRRELSKNISLGKKDLEKEKRERSAKVNEMSSDHVRRLEIALESYKNEADNLEKTRSKNGSPVTDKDLAELLSKFEELKDRHESSKQELSKLSAGGFLPPNIRMAGDVIFNRKSYLNSLMDQIKNPLDLSSSLSDSPFNNSSNQK